MTRRSKFVGPELLVGAIRYVADHHGDVPVALIGGAAMQVYGSPRLTHDLDVAALDLLPSIKQHGSTRTLTFGGIRGRAPNGVEVDVVVRDDEYTHLYDEAVSHAKRVPGLPLPVVLPEYLAAMKMATGRHGKDDQDLEYLIGSGVLDHGRAKDVIRKYLGHYAVQEFDSMVSVVRWKKSEGRWP